MRPDVALSADDVGASAARAVLLAIHLSTWTFVILESFTDFGSGASSPALGVPAAIAVGLLHLRHAFAAANGRRPRWWPLTLTAVAALTWVLPLVHFVSISNAVFFVGGSAALLLPRRFLPLWIGLPTAGGIGDVIRRGLLDGFGSGFRAWYVYYACTVLSLGMLGLYATARVVFVLGQFRETRNETRAITVGTERLRLSRDLHDVLGQSLTAIALKAEVARRLYPIDPAGAARQVRELTELAEQSRAELRTVTEGTRPMTFTGELDGAMRLLRLAGVDTTATVEPPVSDDASDAVWAWAVREGAANVLHHSRAGRCVISVVRAGSSSRFTMANDEPDTTDEPVGSGLAGLSERTGKLGGTVTAGVSADGWFRLVVELPAVVANASATRAGVPG
jgi:two-component system, NarL family, sensor histidine kinase DesK